MGTRKFLLIYPVHACRNFETMKPKNEKLINEILKQAEILPPMPVVARKALRLMSNPNFNMKDLADVLATDEAIASTLLRWANSSYYGLISPVTTIHQAVTYLGETTVRNLVLTGALASYIERPLPGYHLDRGELWKHSLAVAIAGRQITLKFGPQVCEEAYTAGLLADIGKLAFELVLRGINIGPGWSNRSFLELEEHYFGINHAELGAELARRWDLPASLQEAIALHHHPAEGRKDAVLPSAVHVADALVMMLGIGIGRDGLQYELEPFALERMNLSIADIDPLLDRLLPMIMEVNNIASEQA